MIIGNIIIAKNVKKNKPINRIRRNSNNKKIFLISLKRKSHIKSYLRARIFYNDSQSLQITLKEK